jgi:hypothetical protein
MSQITLSKTEVIPKGDLYTRLMYNASQLLMSQRSKSMNAILDGFLLNSEQITMKSKSLSL